MSAPARPARRVAVVLEQCWHEVPGGTATAALSTVRALQAHTDHQLVGVAARHGSPPAEPFAPPIPVRHLRLPRPLLYEAWNRLRRPGVESATGEVDLIHATGMAIPRRTAPLVVTINDLAWRHEPDHFTARGRRFFEACLSTTVAEADAVVAPSEATALDLRSAGVDPARLHVVPYGHRAGIASEEDVRRVRSDRALPDRYVLWVGTIEPRKNLSVVIAAWRRARLGDAGLGLVLVGPKGWEEDLDARLGSDREGVRVLGFVPDDELDALYRGAAVLCYPSLREGFGLPVLEAMAQATPVVTSTGTSTAEVLGPDGGAGRAVDPLDVDAVAGAIVELAEPARRREASRAALDRSAEFSWERTASAISDIYHSVVEG